MQPDGEMPNNPRNRPRHNTSTYAMAMLIRQSVFAAPLPRFHVRPRWVDGTLLVHDRALDEHIKIYTPRFVSQFRAGHRAGLWYLRPAGDLGFAPRSHGFHTARGALEALRSHCWSPAPSPAGRLPTRCRVVWS
jgi:hypothetical protein